MTQEQRVKPSLVKHYSPNRYPEPIHPSGWVFQGVCVCLQLSFTPIDRLPTSHLAQALIAPDGYFQGCPAVEMIVPCPLIWENRLVGFQLLTWG